MKVLVVEDEFTSRRLLNVILSEYGTCHVAVNGKEAVEAFSLAHAQNDRYDLITLDIKMPEMDGIEALRLIREKERAMGIKQQDEVKVIITTVVDTPKEVMDLYYKGGCTDYLLKPIDIKELLKLLKQYEPFSD